ncbi:MAG: hypothetical protein ABI632_00175 [Pseudolysinimonas sp.]
MTNVRTDGAPRLWAFCVFALGWDAVAAIATAAFALALAPRLPPTVTIALPGSGGGGGTYEYAPGTLTIALVGSVAVAAIFAVVLLVLSFTAAKLSAQWFGVILVILSVLVVAVTFALVTCALFQLDHLQSLGSSGEYLGGLRGAVTGVGAVAVVLVLVSALFVLRRLILGAWRAPVRR